MEERQPGIARVDEVPDTVLVVSDLHIGAGQDPLTLKYEPRENFFADDAFRALLEQHDPNAHGSSLLVLDGDIWDFLRIVELPETDADFADWHAALAELDADRPDAELRARAPRERRYGLRTDDYKSVWKLLRVARGHPRFFDALGWWVERGGRIVILKGNHDVELYWPLVQRAARRLVARGRPGLPVDDRLQFEQAGIAVGNVYLEHGHQFEATTAVHGDPVLPGGTELNLPLGSCVNRYIINQLEGIEPFLDNQKPLSKLLTTLFRRHPLKMLRIAVTSLPFLQRAVRRYRFRETLGFVIYFGAIFLPILTILAIGLALGVDAVQNMMAVVPAWMRYAMSAAGLLAPYLVGIVKDLFPKHRPKIGEDAYGEGLFERLGQVGFPARFRRVYGVVGHTHQPDVQLLPGPGAAAEAYYLNSGTWVPLWEESRPDLQGRAVYSLIRFRLERDGEYRHECLEWRPDRGAAVPSVTFAREGMRPAP